MNISIVTPVLMLVVAATAPPDTAALTRARPQLHTPDQIAPAVLPYLACLYAERGLPLLRATDGAQVPYDKSTSNCSAARAKATADAMRLMQGKTAPNGLSVSQFIAQTLSDMDAYVASLPMSATGRPAPQSATVGIPVTIEDEILPAYARYDDCLKTQVANSPVTAETIMSKFNTAIKICASVREFAIGEAKKALIAKGWNEAVRVRAAETTFAKVDESWLTMGRQYQQLLQRGSSPAEAKARTKGISKTRNRSR